jgi:hypothetical protein
MALLGAWTCLLFVFLLNSCFSVEEKKFRQEDGTKSPSIFDPRPFRMNKLNLMWEKAKKVLGIFIAALFVTRFGLIFLVKSRPNTSNALALNILEYSDPLLFFLKSWMDTWTSTESVSIPCCTSLRLPYIRVRLVLLHGFDDSQRCNSHGKTGSYVVQYCFFKYLNDVIAYSGVARCTRGGKRDCHS